MKVKDILREGWFDRFRKKPEPQMLPITDEQRAFIKRFFRESNADMRFAGPYSKYVLELNVHAGHGKGRVSFRNEDGVLKASVAYHSSVEDRVNPRAMPLVYYNVDINTPSDMEKLIRELE